MPKSAVLLFAAALASAQVTITQKGDRVQVEINGKPFTELVTGGTDAMKPYLWPIRAASGTEVTRHFPMEKVEGESNDHQHQRGIWFGHESTNGLDFWNNEATYKTPNRGRTVLDKIVSAKSGKLAGTLAVNFIGEDMQGNKILEEHRVMTFSSNPTLRIIDFDITLVAIAKVKFGDAKDGTFGIRLSDALREDKGSGTITNAEGEQHEKAVWGKPSNWVDYSGKINGEALGVTIFDHPMNSRRARWHVRAYGLFAANPFGLSVFTNDKTEDGSVTIEPGQLHFRYRVLIHPGDVHSTDLAKMWDEFRR